MIIGFVAIGMMVGAVAGVYSLLVGASILFALTIYSGIGVLAALSAIAVALIISALRFTEVDRSESEAEPRPVSA